MLMRMSQYVDKTRAWQGSVVVIWFEVLQNVYTSFSPKSLSPSPLTTWGYAVVLVREAWKGSCLTMPCIGYAVNMKLITGLHPGLWYDELGIFSPPGQAKKGHWQAPRQARSRLFNISLWTKNFLCFCLMFLRGEGGDGVPVDKADEYESDNSIVGGTVQF